MKTKIFNEIVDGVDTLIYDIDILARKVDRLSLFNEAPSIRELREWSDALADCVEAAVRVSKDAAAAARPARRPTKRRNPAARLVLH